MWIRLHTTAGHPVLLNTDKMSNFKYNVSSSGSTNVSFMLEDEEVSMFVSDSNEILEDVCREISNQEVTT